LIYHPFSEKIIPHLSFWRIEEGNSPLVATAIHNGHVMRKEVARICALNEIERFHEEDPFTEEWTPIADTRIIIYRSRFEVDLNRPRQKAVYLEPKDAWGLQIWKSRPSPKMINQILKEYDAFYNEIKRILTDLRHRFKHLVVFDLHTYNHRRAGPKTPPADKRINPEVNIGTGTMDRNLWAPLVDRFITDLRAFSFLGRQLDVRENIKFMGGHMARWIHSHFSESVCVLSIEFKKFFMDEWTNEPDPIQLNEIRQALQFTVPGILEELEKK